MGQNGSLSDLNGRAGISPEMAIRLSLAFDTSPESWLNQQAQYDLWLARQKQHEIHVEKLYVGDPISQQLDEFIEQYQPALEAWQNSSSLPFSANSLPATSLLRSTPITSS